MFLIYGINSFMNGYVQHIVPFWMHAIYMKETLNISYDMVYQLVQKIFVPMLLIQSVLYLYIKKKWGDFSILLIGCLCNGMFFFIIPFAFSLPHGAVYHNHNGMIRRCRP